MEIKTMIPETSARGYPKKYSGEKLRMAKYATNAPSGSTTPERKENIKANFLFVLFSHPLISFFTAHLPRRAAMWK